MILPIYAGLERIPKSLLEASADLGGALAPTTFSRVVLPLAFPAVVAGSIFTFSLTLGDYVAPGLITSEQFIGTVIYDIRGAGAALRGCLRDGPDRRHRPSTCSSRGSSARSSRSDGRVAAHPDPASARRRRSRSRSSTSRCSSSRCTRSTRTSRRVGRSRTSATKWFSVAFHERGRAGALWLSVYAALGATASPSCWERSRRRGRRAIASSAAR